MILLHGRQWVWVVWMMYTYIRVGEWVVDFHGDVDKGKSGFDKSDIGFNHEFSISPIPSSPFRFQVLDFFLKFYFSGYHDANFMLLFVLL